MSANAVNTLYTVAVGDSLSKLATRFYGDPAKFALIAERNNLQPTSILMIGQRLIIPPAVVPQSTAPTGDAQLTVVDGQSIETVTATASVWYKDWRYWVAIGAGTLVLGYFIKRGLRR